jgi:hypothetical protein
MTASTIASIPTAIVYTDCTRPSKRALRSGRRGSWSATRADASLPTVPDRSDSMSEARLKPASGADRKKMAAHTRYTLNGVRYRCRRPPRYSAVSQPGLARPRSVRTILNFMSRFATSSNSSRKKRRADRSSGRIRRRPQLEQYSRVSSAEQFRHFDMGAILLVAGRNNSGHRMTLATASVSRASWRRLSR